MSEQVSRRVTDELLRSVSAGAEDPHSSGTAKRVHTVILRSKFSNPSRDPSSILKQRTEMLN